MDLVAQGKITEHKQMRALGDIYGPDSTPDARAKALQVLHQKGGNVLKAKEAWINYSTVGTVDLIEKATSVLNGVKVQALEKSTVKPLIPKALDNLISAAQNLKKTLAAITVGTLP